MLPIGGIIGAGVGTGLSWMDHFNKVKQAKKDILNKTGALGRTQGINEQLNIQSDPEAIYKNLTSNVQTQNAINTNNAMNASVNSQSGDSFNPSMLMKANSNAAGTNAMAMNDAYGKYQEAKNQDLNMQKENFGREEIARKDLDEAKSSVPTLLEGFGNSVLSGVKGFTSGMGMQSAVQGLGKEEIPGSVPKVAEVTQDNPETTAGVPVSPEIDINKAIEGVNTTFDSIYPQKKKPISLLRPRTGSTLDFLNNPLGG